jgi:CrcB protein
MNHATAVLLAGTGGALGSILRYLTGVFVHLTLGVSGFPLGTMLVNIIGCGAIGVLGAMFETRDAFGPGMRVFLLVGVLGGFTTFSSFAYETLVLVRDGAVLRAALNVVAQTTLGLLAAGAGWWLVARA